jgi:hypothetical protein
VQDILIYNGDILEIHASLLIPRLDVLRKRSESNPDDVGILSGLCSASDVRLIWSVQPTMDMTLESVYNVLDHSIHAELDKMVIKSCMEPSNCPLAEHLLLNIVLQSQGTLDAKYTNMWHV